ncbi:hypothetical protein LOD99_11401 [Oopsacas minuta]|uniref:Uncharacterized protein n=1 Tax=Oopsacas minuta TaxID=111878 RepID=A0AAV7K3W2_9METZ|nr:hypothetical protein LOD99_11401 [Oopsacas minuta]
MSAEVKEWELDYSFKKKPVIAVRKEGEADNKLYEPNQLIYRADFGYCRLQVVAFEGNFVTNFVDDLKVASTRGSGEGELDHPRGLCTDYDGDVYVADSSNHRVCIYSDELKFQII